MPLATIAPASIVAPEEGSLGERDHALLREAAARMATSLVRFTAARRRRSPDAADLVVVDHVATDEAAYQLSGELLAPASNAPVVLISIEREPDTYPSHRELRTAFGLTRAEARVATMLAERKSNSEIARELGVTGATARRHTERLLLKLGVSRRAAVRHTLIQRIGGGCTGLARAVCSEERASAGNRLGERAQSRGACQTALALSRADDVGECTSESRRGRPKKRTVRRRGLKESIVVLLAREHERQLVRDALAGEVRVHFAEGPRDVHPPWRNEAPIAVLVELHEEREHRMERALGILRREAPSIPRWAWIELVPASVHMAMRLATRGLIAAAITSGDDPGRRLRELLKNARALSESEALSKVWGEWARPETQVILEACIAASATATTVRDVQHQLNKSLRTLNRELSAQGLPSLARILAFCRLLRAMYRLDHRDIKVKAVASGLGYKYPSALSHQLHWFTGLSIASLPAGSRFATIAALLSADLSAKRSQTHAGKDRDAASRQRRQPKRGTHGSGMREMSATI